MPGTRTVPDPTGGNPTNVDVSFCWIDAEGIQRSFEETVDPAITNATVESLAAACQAQSNASLFRISISSHWIGAAIGGNALNQAYLSVYDPIRYSYKDLSSKAYRRWYVPSPLSGQILPGNVVDTGSGVWQAVNVAFDAVQPAAYIYLNTSLVNNTKRNVAVKTNN